MNHTTLLDIISNNVKNATTINIKKKNTFCLRQKKYKDNTTTIDVTKLSNILEINTIDNYITVEPLVTMENLFHYTQKYNLMIPCITEFKDMTIGGATIGLGGESTSFKFGLFHDANVIEYELVIGDGEIITVNKDNNKKLFESIPGSYGSFGIVTKLKLKLIECKKYVKLNYYHIYNLNSLLTTIKAYANDTIDFMDCVCISKNHYILMIGELTNTISYYNYLLNYNSLYYFWSKWFYNIIINTNNSQLHYMSLYDYLFRYDRGSFWVASKKIKHTFLNRILYGSKLTTTNLYKYALNKSTFERESGKIYQDIAIPFHKLENFLTILDDNVNIYPLWLLPIKSPNYDGLFSYKSIDNFYMNVGIYGKPSDRIFDFINKNKYIETKTKDFGGFKCLYSQNYYNHGEFWSIYNKNTYDSLREKYHAYKFTSIYEKVNEFYISLVTQKQINLVNHTKKVEGIVNDFKENLDKQIVLKRRNADKSHSTRTVSYKDDKYKLDMSDFNTILYIDAEKYIAIVEPNITIKELVEETMKYKLSPYVIPELSGLTVGGLIQGTGLESTSFKYGEFSEMIDSLDILIGDGSVITATQNNKYSDIFYGIQGSFGSIGIITKITLKLKKLSPYINLTYHILNNYDEAFYKLSAMCRLNDIDYLDGIVLDKNKVILITGHNTSTIDYNLYDINGTYSPWYFNHLKDISNKKIYHETVTFKDYTFRYDQGCFWTGQYARIKKIIPIGKMRVFHPLLKSYFTTENMYKKLHTKSEEERAKRFLFQDVYIPESKLSHFITEYTHNDQLGIYPLWLCPVKITKNIQPFVNNYLPNTNDKFCIDVGIYGCPKKTPFDPIELNRKLEDSINDCNGRKMLYASVYYNKVSFWKIYNCFEWYQMIRNKYQTQNNLVSIDNKLIKYDY
jgi:FAD/FMN-containing dehydrogenase